MKIEVDKKEVEQLEDQIDGLQNTLREVVKLYAINQKTLREVEGKLSDMCEWTHDDNVAFLINGCLKLIRKQLGEYKDLPK